MGAWNGWYHVDGHTYGTWLRGDPRGWRSRKHREHVEGDYKSPPPPGRHDRLREQSRRLMKGPPVRLDRNQRRVAGQAMVAKLLALGVEVLAVSLDAVHYHILARFPDGDVRKPVGLAKKTASVLLSAHGLRGVVWAKRRRALPVRDRTHQVNVFRYTRRHADQGAWVWTFCEGLDGLTDGDC